MILLDTNLLMRMTRPLDPQCRVARAAFRLAGAEGSGSSWCRKTCTNSGPWQLGRLARLLPEAMGWECPLARRHSGCVSSNGVLLCCLTTTN
jgi:hypothetical protein